MKIRTKIGANKFTKYAKRIGDFREYDLFANVIDKISEEIPLAMQETIEKTPSALVPGKIGRIWTSHMHDSVSVIVPDNVTVEYGWIEGSNKFDGGWDHDYILGQEYGDDRVWGMKALDKVAKQVKLDEKTRKEVYTETRRIWKWGR